jgi:hypothetical protein
MQPRLLGCLLLELGNAFGMERIGYAKSLVAMQSIQAEPASRVGLTQALGRKEHR